MVERRFSYRRGQYPRQGCSFTHGDAELRRFSAPYGGKRNYRDEDLRDKLYRRLTPEARNSTGRDARDWRILGYSPFMATDKKRNRRKKEHLDGESDFSENLKLSNEIKDSTIEGRNISNTPKSTFKNQLNEVHVDIATLIQHKHELEIFLEEKVQEADSLTSQIKELDSQLEKEKEEYKRIISRIKKFVGAHNRCSQIGGELKTSQTLLEKLGEKLSLNIYGASADEENSDVKIVSDGETNGCKMSTPQNETRGNSSLSKKRLCDHQNITEGSITDGKGQAENMRLRKQSQWSENPTQSNIDEENMPLNNRNSRAMPLASDEGLRKRKKVSVSTSTADKLNGAQTSFSLPSTSMAAHTVNDDEVLEIEEEVQVPGLPFLLPLPPPNLQNSYAQYEGKDQNVDIEGPEEEMVGMDNL